MPDRRSRRSRRASDDLKDWEARIESMAMRYLAELNSPPQTQYYSGHHSQQYSQYYPQHQPVDNTPHHPTYHSSTQTRNYSRVHSTRTGPAVFNVHTRVTDRNGSRERSFSSQNHQGHDISYGYALPTAEMNGYQYQPGLPADRSGTYRQSHAARYGPGSYNTVNTRTQQTRPEFGGMSVPFSAGVYDTSNPAHHPNYEPYYTQRQPTPTENWVASMAMARPVDQSTPDMPSSDSPPDSNTEVLPRRPPNPRMPTTWSEYGERSPSVVRGSAARPTCSSSEESAPPVTKTSDPVQRHKPSPRARKPTGESLGTPTYRDPRDSY